MRIIQIVLLACLVGSVEAAVYQWQDGDGKTQYGDNPPAGVTAEPVILSPITTVPSPVREGGTAETEPDAGEVVAVEPYSRLTITQPTNGQTIRTDTGRVEISVDLRPALQEAAGHRLIAIVDGKRIPGSGHVVAILAARGPHRAQVAVVDAEGKALVWSGQIAFDIRSDKRLPMSRELKAIRGVHPAN